MTYVKFKELYPHVKKISKQLLDSLNIFKIIRINRGDISCQYYNGWVNAKRFPIYPIIYILYHRLLILHEKYLQYIIKTNM